MNQDSKKTQASQNRHRSEHPWADLELDFRKVCKMRRKGVTPIFWDKFRERIRNRAFHTTRAFLRDGAGRYRPSDAEDAVQDWMLLLELGLYEKQKTGMPFYPLAYEVLWRICRRMAPYCDRFISIGEREPTDDRMNPVVQWEIEDRRQSVRMALGKLRPDDRALLCERYCDDRSLDELASAKGIHKANLKTQIHRASARMRGELGSGFDVDHFGRKRTNSRKKRFR
jgi:RNA polymerase sigma factor (sigma-70 family)